MNDLAAKGAKKGEAWPMVRLGVVCDINLGKTPPRGNYNCWDKSKKSDCVWVSIADMSNLIEGKIVDSKEYITKFAVDNYGVPVVSKGTLLVSFKLTLGRTAIAGRDLYTNEAIAALPIKEAFKERICLEYLTLYFSFFDWQLFAEKDDKVLGKTLNKKKLAEVPVLLPPLEVQRKIVERLEKELGEADALAEKFRQMAEFSDAEFKAELDETFKDLEGMCVGEGDGEVLTQRRRGAEVRRVRLGDVFDIVSARRVHKSDWKNDGVPFYRTREIVKLADLGYVENSLFISNALYEKYKGSNGVPKVNDLMVTGVGTVGRVYIVKETDKFYYKDASVLCFQNKLSTNPVYSKYYIESPAFRTVIHEKSMGATVDTITMERAKEYPFVLPNSEIQKSVVAKLDSAKERCEKLKAAAERGLRAAENLRKAILAEAFE